ncbi:MAG: lamin tail domain-containing protein [Amnibacterium sp.]
MKKRTLTALALLAAAAFTASVAAPADAANPVLHFSAAEPNSPGSDRGGNTSLNGEWVRLSNSSRTASYVLTGWTIRDRANHVYKFGSFTLKPGASVTLHTGAGTNTSTSRYWGQRWYVWNNTGDEAYLKTSGGVTKDTCTWPSTRDGVVVVC